MKSKFILILKICIVLVKADDFNKNDSSEKPAIRYHFTVNKQHISNDTFETDPDNSFINNDNQAKPIVKYESLLEFSCIGDQENESNQKNKSEHYLMVDNRSCGIFNHSNRRNKRCLCLFAPSPVAAPPPIAVPSPSAYTYPSSAPSYPSQNVQYPSNNYQYSQNQQYQSNNYQYNRPQIPRASNPYQQTSSNNFQSNNNFNNFQPQPSQTFNSAPSPPLPAPPPPPPPIPEPPIAAIPPPVNAFQPIIPPLISPPATPLTIPTITLPVVETATITPEIPTSASLHKPEYPLPECYTNDKGFMCCNRALEHVINEAVEELKESRNGKWKNCNIQAIANRVQKKAEERFNLTFEVISGVRDFASKSHFYMDNICKTRGEGRYILAYATSVPENRRKRAQYEQIVDEAIFDDQKSLDYETVQNDDKHFHTWKM